jgi:hypothetical protein
MPPLNHAYSGIEFAGGGAILKEGTIVKGCNPRDVIVRHPKSPSKLPGLEEEIPAAGPLHFEQEVVT